MSCFRSCATFISSSDIDQQVHLEQLHWTKKGFKKAVPSTPIRIELYWHESWRYTMWLYLDIFFVCSPGIQAVPVMRSAWVVQPCTDQSGSTRDFHEVESSLIFSKLIKNDPTVLGISDGEKILASNKKIAGDINLLRYYAMLSKQSCVFSFVQQACDVRTKEVSLDDRPVYLQSYVTCSYSSNLNSSSKPSKWQTSFWDATRMYWAVGNLAVTLLLKSSFGWALPRHKTFDPKNVFKKTNATEKGTKQLRTEEIKWTLARGDLQMDSSKWVLQTNTVHGGMNYWLQVSSCSMISTSSYIWTQASL